MKLITLLSFFLATLLFVTDSPQKSGEIILPEVVITGDADPYNFSEEFCIHLPGITVLGERTTSKNSKPIILSEIVIEGRQTDSNVATSFSSPEFSDIENK